VAFFTPSRLRSSRQKIAAFDQAVEDRVARLRSPALDRIAYPLSSAADHSMLWHAVGLARALRTHDPKFAVRFSSAMGIESAITNVAVKSVFQRLRPNRSVDAPLLYGLRQPITSSFPSGHATAAFCAATLLAKGSRAAPMWFALASAVAATRVYVRLHHASDVIAGAAFGVALGTALRPLLDLSGRARP
jgi:membrane-associated phospholipid phosphatase